jgi:predicted RNase H-like HicB family nuclease
LSPRSKLVRPIRHDGRLFHLTFESDDGKILVGCRELRGLRTSGATFAEARENALDAIEAYLDAE